MTHPGSGARAPAVLSALIVLAASAGCGQKGPLLRRDAKASTAVTIRGPSGDTAPASPTGPPAAEDAASAAPAPDAASVPDASPATPRSDEPDAPRHP